MKVILVYNNGDVMIDEMMDGRFPNVIRVKHPKPFSFYPFTTTNPIPESCFMEKIFVRDDKSGHYLELSDMICAK